MSSHNERIKLKAIFWNNLAVAAVTAGIVVPLLGAYHDDSLWNATVYPAFSDVAKRFFVALIPALVCAAGFRSYANYLMTKLTDD